MYQPGEMTFRTRIPYNSMITMAFEADDCHILMETLALVKDFDGVRRTIRGIIPMYVGIDEPISEVSTRDLEQLLRRLEMNQSRNDERLGLSFEPTTPAPPPSLPEFLAMSSEDCLAFCRQEGEIFYSRDEPTTPAPAVPEVPEFSCDLTLCSDDDLWAELARRGLMVNGGEAILINDC